MKSPQDQEDISLIENPIKIAEKEQPEDEPAEDTMSLGTNEDELEALCAQATREDTWHWYASVF